MTGIKTWFYLLITRFLFHYKFFTAEEGEHRQGQLYLGSMDWLAILVGGIVAYIFMKEQLKFYHLSFCDPPNINDY